MIRAKKTLYEILQVANSASDLEIISAYENLTQKLKLKESILGAEEVQLQQKVLDLAYSTLSVYTSRQAYDAKLKYQNAPTPDEVLPPLKKEMNSEHRHSPLRSVLVVIAGVMVIWLSLQVIFMIFAYRNNSAVVASPSDIQSQAEEKVRMQEYYQEHGVRAGSRMEADLIEADQQRKDAEIRERERAKEEQQRKYEQFVRDSKRVGDEVSRNLKRAEDEAHYKAEREKAQQEEEKRRADEVERRRIEREKNKWRLGSSGASYDNSSDE